MSRTTSQFHVMCFIAVGVLALKSLFPSTESKLLGVYAQDVSVRLGLSLQQRLQSRWFLIGCSFRHQFGSSVVEIQRGVGPLH